MGHADLAYPARQPENINLTAVHLCGCKSVMSKHEELCCMNMRKICGDIGAGMVVNTAGVMIFYLSASG